MLDLREVKLGELGRVITGRTPPSSQPELLGDQAAFITPTDMHEGSIYAEPKRRLSKDGEIEFRKLLLPPDAVCFTCIASIGKMCLTRETSVTNQQINAIVVDQSQYDPRWVFYVLKSMRDQIAAIASGSATPIINKAAFSNISVQAPTLETQRRIAAILGAYDDLIEVNRRRVAVLEEMARGLFEEWFVRFRFPGHETVPILDTPDGPLPEGWEWMPFSALAPEVRDTVDPCSVDSGTRYVGLEHIPRRSTTLADYGLSEDVGSLKARFRRGDILFGKIRPYFHKVVWAPFEGISSTDAIIWRPRPGHSARALAVASSDAFVAHSVQTSNGTKMPRANAKVLAAYPCAQSNIGLEERFEAVAMPLVEQAAALQAMNEKLAASRDLLLPRLISGQLSVEAAEHQLEAAA